MDKFILLGYMGSGKSTVASLLAERLKLPHIDLDEVIEACAGATIANLFKQKGELYFRKIEHEKFTEMIDNKASFVLSLGGGTPCYFNNHELLKSPGVQSFYLKMSIACLSDRLSHGINTRPLISNLDPNQLTEFVAKHLFERSFYYNQAQHTISADEKSAAEIVSEIEKKLV